MIYKSEEHKVERTDKADLHHDKAIVQQHLKSTI